MTSLLPLLLVLALPPDPAAAAALGWWDERRAAAYAAGDPAALRSLYLPGSAAGRADVAVLRAYARRGLRVTGVQTQLLAVRVVGRRPGGWTLRVTDRLVGGVARGRGVAVSLPRDRPSTWRVGLVWRAGGWRVAQASAVATTASTSRSRNR